MLTKTNGMIGVLNEDISYRADWDTAKTRYYSVTVLRLQPGYGRDYETLRKLVNGAHDKAKVDERWAVYEVASGAPDDTYISCCWSRSRSGTSPRRCTRVLRVASCAPARQRLALSNPRSIDSAIAL